jgi:SlyX protein
MANEERIVELEVRVAYQDKIIADLDEVIRSFTVRVERLERELREVRDLASQGSPDADGNDPPPPHY